MGFVTVSSETAFRRPAAEIYDFVTDPTNWPRTYSGSAGIHDLPALPLQPSDTWRETADLSSEHETYSGWFSWRLLTARRPTLWAFQSLGALGAEEDGSGGFDGITTITYEFLSPGAEVTLFRRTMRCEVARGVRIPDLLLGATFQPAGIEAYHEAVDRELQRAADES